MKRHAERRTLRGAVLRRRAQMRDLLVRRVRYWVQGTESNFPGDPRRQLEADHTTWAPMRLVQFHSTDGVPVTIGRYTGIHHTVTIVQGGLHHVDWVGVAHLHLQDGQLMVPEEFPYSKGRVVIGGDVWIGFEALIMSGLTIGHGSVVAARAVVTSSVEPYSIVAGSPAKHVKYRFDQPTREALLRIKWWDWPDEKIARHRAEIDSPDVAGFIARHDSGS